MDALKKANKLAKEADRYHQYACADQREAREYAENQPDAEGKDIMQRIASIIGVYRARIFDLAVQLLSLEGDLENLAAKHSNEVDKAYRDGYLAGMDHAHGIAIKHSQVPALSSKVARAVADDIENYIEREERRHQ